MDFDKHFERTEKKAVWFGVVALVLNAATFGFVGWLLYKLVMAVIAKLQS